MHTNFQNTNVYIILSESMYANKFVEYCLGLSNYFYLGESLSFNHLQNNNNMSYRLNFCKSRIPPTDDQKFVRPNWYFGYNFYYEACQEWKKGHCVEAETSEFIEITNSDFKFCIYTNAIGVELKNLLKIWPNCSIIRLLNVDDYFFDGDRLHIKEIYENIQTEGWPSWEQADKSNFFISHECKNFEDAQQVRNFFHWEDVSRPIFDFDMNLMFDGRKFCQRMYDLYLWTHVNDFNQDSLIDYFNCYTHVVQPKKSIV